MKEPVLSTTHSVQGKNILTVSKYLEYDVNGSGTERGPMIEFGRGGIELSGFTNGMKRYVQ